MILKNNIVSKFAYSFILITACISCISKTEDKDDISDSVLANITFKKREHDFGNIPSGKGVSTLFQFSNTGENPLLIKDVTTSCGCTVPEWPKEIIKPNENGEIKIVYDAKYPSRFNKTITVIYNGEASPLELTIKGEVLYPEKGKTSSK